MPNYEFACPDCALVEEKYFSFSEEHKLECAKCGVAMKKVIKATPAIFHGGGWGKS